jgi:TIR domain
LEVWALAFDVFISYASKDKIVADAVCARLEASGVRCWIAPRDIVAGTSYGEAIIEAIHGAKVMVLVFSSSANASGHIPKEVERAVSSGVAVLPFRIEDVAPGKSLDYFIGSVHWLDAMTPPMEKHLDNLAATVHKLLPVKTGETAAPTPTDPTVMWQRNAAAAEPEHAATVLASAARAAATAPMVDATRAGVGDGTGGEGPRAGILNSKMVLIGAAAVLVLAAVVVGMMLMRGGGNSQGAGDSAANPSGGNDGAGDSTSGNSAVTPSARTTPSSTAHKSASSGVNGGVDPIVGCYQWFNNAPVVIRADGTMTGGPFTAHWRLVDAGRRAYTFTWPVMVETLTVSPDQRTMSGGNQFGYPISGGRVSGTVGLAGTWHWANGWNVSVAPNGTFTSGTWRGTWRAVDLSRGLYEMYWPAPVDSVLLLGGGTRISGKNQYGVAISGVKTGACGG